MFDERHMPQVGQTVLEHRSAALSLYQRSGFALAYAGIGGWRDLAGPAQEAAHS